MRQTTLTALLVISILITAGWAQSAVLEYKETIVKNSIPSNSLSAEHNELVLNITEQVITANSAQTLKFIPEYGLNIINSVPKIKIELEPYTAPKPPTKPTNTTNPLSIKDSKSPTSTYPEIRGGTPREVHQLQEVLEKFRPEAFDGIKYIAIANMKNCEIKRVHDEKEKWCILGDYSKENIITLYDLGKGDNDLPETINQMLRHHYEYKKYGNKVFETHKSGMPFIEDSLQSPNFYKTDKEKYYYGEY